ncbi:MAG: apolipoprotein N-acyltransferase, partial [Rikenellaceae bacterium]
MKKLLAIFISIALLSTGWLGWSGLTLLVALTPLLWISAEAEDSRRGWWQTFAYALLCFVGWNLSTIWWIGYSTPVGPVAATFASSLLSMIAFMVFHTISKKASKALSYTILISLWITLEYAYTTSDFSWPWLLLGNGLSNDVWAVQWYEFTGLFGGSLWILLTNILLFEGVYKSTKLLTIIPGLALAITPLILSTIMFITYQEPNKGEVRVSVIQPNIDCYDKFNGSEKTQQELLARLAGEAPKDSQFIVMPETAIPGHFFETQINNYKYIQRLRDSIAHRDINNMLITGANTIIRYQSADESPTARSYGENYIDIFNSAITITPYKRMVGIHHKAKLVIGVEQTPTWIFKLFKFFVIDLGGVVGQIGRGEEATVFEHDGVKFGTAVCYEGLYG